MEAKITLLPGDGIGPEVVNEAVKVLTAVAAQHTHTFTFTEKMAGGIAIDETGDPLPEDTLGACLESDAVLLGAVGGPKWSDPKAAVRPEQGLLKLRKSLGVFANIRPVKVFAALADASPLRPERVQNVDIVFVRELTGGIYFGQPQGREMVDGLRSGHDTMRYNEMEIKRVVNVAFKLAQGRRGKVTSVDKANVLASSRVWREVAHEVAAEYPDIEYEDVLVDAMAMYLVNRPGDFDVVVTGNMFGDILSDEASMISGSLGMLPSAALGEGMLGLYEPIHGSAPDIAGKGIANPLATILSTAMLLRSSLGLEEEASKVETAVSQVLAAGYRTADLARGGETAVNTQEMGDLVVKAL
ncbi:MAG: 3-isopropylmalate dehydrogenase [Ardenticatenaceae bacterium]|nr:3-isopropylmalate dehydrogenase [Ardenticatenaceae bacterium]MCB9443199.1 3-isopropylmalate dehydrogenase [Ardenticatenaceae bacterium]